MSLKACVRTMILTWSVLASAPEEARRLAASGPKGDIAVRMLAVTPELEVGEISFPAGVTGSSHRHGMTEIFYVLEGMLGHTVDGETVWLSPGDVGVVQAGQPVAHSTSSDGPVQALVLWAPAGGADELVTRFGFREEPEAKRVGILVFDGFLTSEVSAVIEVFGAAAKSCLTSHEIVSVAVGEKSVRSAEGLSMVADLTLNDAPELDVIVVPSAHDMGPLLSNEPLVDFLKASAASSSFVAGNCSGVFLLGRADLLEGRRATTFPGGEAKLQELYPSATIVSDVDVVDDGDLITSSGATVTYDASLTLLEKLAGRGCAEKVAAHLYYSWSRAH